MYTLSAEYYDTIYSWKDYRKESLKLQRLIQRYKQSRGNRLLDVGCGTGEHLKHFKTQYQCEGLDLNPRMLKIARRKHPDLTFHQADMANFHLDGKFDVILSLFSGIGHLKTQQRLHKAIKNMAQHLQPGGVLIIEPWITPRQFKPVGIRALFVNKPRIKIARMNLSLVRGRLSTMTLHHLIGTPEKIQYFTENLELGLFTKQEYQSSIKDAGLKLSYDPKGLIGRGLYIGTKPLSQ
jgi:ubiquinone/menaquinone biosynthesis C-methylase UbiE